MKAVFSLLLTLSFFTARTQSLPVDSIITRTSLQLTVATLSADSMKGRLTGMPETKIAAEFIASQFEKAGLKPLAGNDDFFSWYPIRYQLKEKIITVEAINVLAAIKGNESPDTSVIFCAHYDHIGVKRIIQKYDRDTIFNGANDNASGVALLIELAKYYSAIKANRYTLVFIAFSGEELGLLGSAYTASNIDQSFVKAVINFDMVGRPVDSWTKKCMVIAERPGPVINKLNAQLSQKNGFFMPDMFPEENLFKRSDHYSFKNVKDKIFFTASAPRDKYYHTLVDEYDTLDFDFLLLTAKNIATSCRIFIE